MMRKLLFSAMLALATASTVHAGGLMTNTNYHIAFDRMFARAATTEIDAAYSNPAGLAAEPRHRMQYPWFPGFKFRQEVQWCSFCSHRAGSLCCLQKTELGFLRHDRYRG